MKLDYDFYTFNLLDIIMTTGNCNLTPEQLERFNKAREKENERVRLQQLEHTCKWCGSKIYTTICGHCGGSEGE